MQSPHPQHPSGHHQMHMSPQPLLNHQMGRPPMGPSPVMNHSQPNLHHPPPPPHNQHGNYMGAPMNPNSSMHHPQQNHHPQQHPSPQMMHHNSHPPPLPPPPPPPPSHINQYNPVIGRHSPYYPNMPQTEFRIYELNRRLQCRPFLNRPVNPLPIHNQYDESSWWERLIIDFFDPEATLSLIIQLDDKPIKYTIGRTLIPRFFRSYFEGGVTDLSINLHNPKETCYSNVITLESDHTNIVTDNLIKHPAMQGPKAVVHTEGRLLLEFVNNCDELYIKSWKFTTKYCREYIDRSVMSMVQPCTIEPVTRQGLTRNTLFYLKMCMIIEPMQVIMSLHKQTKQEPSSCLKNFLIERYNYKGNDNRQTNKRRKRKPSAQNNGGTGTTKKSKANANSNLSNTNSLSSNCLPNNVPMSPATNAAPAILAGDGNPAGFSLVSQDVMVVGEPSLMGGEFGNGNERMITRMENQFDHHSGTNDVSAKLQ